jgi:general secretion pathway protein A
MYQHFYQFTSNPFRLAPEPDFCFSHTGYRRAREYLEFALAQGEGFVMVTGRPGTGKTMLVETFLKTVKAGEVIARRIAVSSYGADDLLRAVAYAYGIEAAGLEKGTLRHRIQQFFMQQERSGRRVLLIIDEAQTLSHAALEELRILADMQTESRLMLQLFLVGQESLQELMDIAEMEQFQQRVIANYHLTPLNLEDTRSYIEHRLRQAGWSGDPEFSSAAVLGIYQLSKGVPRHINKICNRLLLLGYGKGSHTIDEQDVLEISAEMHEERLAPLESNPTPHFDTDNVTNISDIRDSQLSITDLAIRAGKVDACAAAIAEVSRQATEDKEAFFARHDTPPHSGDKRISPSDIELAAAVAVAPEPLHAANESPGKRRHSKDAEKDRRTDRFRWKKALAIMAAPLVLLVILIMAVPSFQGRETVRYVSTQGRELVSYASIQGREAVRYVRSFMDRFSTPGWQVAVLQERSGVADVENETQAKADDGNGHSSVPDADTTTLTATDSSEFQSAIGVINRQQENTAPRIQATPVTKATEQTDAINTGRVEVLLARARQALDDYRLVTPEGDNAHEYLLATLQLDPANETAREGIQEIVEIYITLAAKAADNNEIERAGRYLERGLGIQPAHPELLAMKDRLDGNIGPSPVTQVSPVTQLSAGRTVQSAGDFATLSKQPPLRKRQAAGRRRDVNAMSDRDI